MFGSRGGGTVVTVRVLYSDDTNLNSGVDVIDKFYHSYTTLRFNKALWLDVTSHATSFDQSERFI